MKPNQINHIYLLGWYKINVVFDVQLQKIIIPFIINFINRNKNHWNRHIFANEKQVYLSH